jgi:CRP-like cAMP-binding protein
MSPSLRCAIRRLKRQRRGLRAFDEALRAAGGMVSSVDRGIVEVPVERIVGSVNRWQVLGSDFFYRTGEKVTQRFRRVAAAMTAGKALPALEVYRIKRPEATSEYYVLDGHHRVAVARRLGQDFLDAHVVEFGVAGSPVESPPSATGEDASAVAAPAVRRGARLASMLRRGRGEEQLAHVLRRVPLFREAPSRDLVAVWRVLSEERVAAGTVVCRRGGPGTRFYVVQAGSVEVRLGTGPAGTVLYRLGPGDCFGELALLIGSPRTADVVALEDGVLWVLERADFQRIVSGSTRLLGALSRALAERLAMATLVIEQAESGVPQAGPAGLRIGPYRVVAQLGTGGMSVVYSAVREADGLAVALKVLPASWGAAPELRARLDREAAMLSGLQHPGIVRVLEVGAVAERLGGGTYLAMEWLPDALDRIMRARYPEPLPTAQSVKIARWVAEALAAVHASGLVHRDVKPANILLRADGQPVLTDFGLAAALAERANELRLTPANVLVGTADYLAPEEIGGGRVDGRADVYGLGVVLYEMLTGFVPFAGRDPLQTLRAHREDAVPPLPDQLPAALREIVARALAKQPEDRFPSAAALAEALALLAF